MYFICIFVFLLMILFILINGRKRMYKYNQRQDYCYDLKNPKIFNIENINLKEFNKNETLILKLTIKSNILSKLFTPYIKVSLENKVEKNIGIATNNIFHKVSVWVNKYAGGPAAFVYKYLGACAGLVAGAKIKAALTDIVKTIGKASVGAAIAATMPGMSWILTMLKTIASGIWYVEVGQLAISALGDAGATATKKIKGSKDSDEEKPSDNSEEKPQEKNKQRYIIKVL